MFVTVVLSELNRNDEPCRVVQQCVKGVLEVSLFDVIGINIWAWMYAMYVTDPTE